MAGGEACEREAEGDAAAQNTWQGSRGVRERGAESSALLNIYSHITDLMAFNRRLCKRSGIGTKGAGGIIILTRGAKEHGKIRAEQSC